jgi:hypothetical protein
MTQLIYINPILYRVIASICVCAAIFVGILLIKASKKYNHSLFMYFGLYEIGIALSTICIIIRLQIPGEAENAMVTPDGMLFYVLSGVFTLFANSSVIIGINYLQKIHISRNIIIVITAMIIYFATLYLFYYILKREGIFIMNMHSFDYLRIVGEVIALMFGTVYYFVILGRLIRKASGILKLKIQIILIVSIMLLTIFLLSRAEIIYFSGLNEITGIFLIMNFSILLYLHPEISYILPTKLYRLNVIINQSGMPAYTYDFSTFDTPDMLFTGILFSLNKICFEIFKQGQLQEIRFKEGYLLLVEQEHFSIGLILSEPSYYLSQALNDFSVEFEALFKEKIAKTIDLIDFKGADQLIAKHFALIPKPQ